MILHQANPLPIAYVTQATYGRSNTLRTKHLDRQLVLALRL